MSLLGIDVGTTGCKAVVFSTAGEVLASAYEEYDYARPQPGWAELDSRQVWEQILRTIRTAAAGTGEDPLQALCVSSLGEAVVPVSRDRKVLGPSILNFDSRGAEYLPGLRQQISDERLFGLNGNTLGNHYSLTKLFWLKEHQPEIYEQADYFLHWSGFVSFMLGAEAAVDFSLANRSLLFDLERADWSQELSNLFDIELGKLPPTVPSGSQIGSIAPAAAAELGLPAGIPIVSGAHDQCSNSVGCGVTEVGQAMYGMGTYICMTPVYERRPLAPAMISQGLNTEHHAAPGKFVSFIYNQGGALVKWYRDTFAIQERRQAALEGVDVYNALTAEIPEAPSRVMALPHFTATGPPSFIADSCGVLAGLYLDTPRGEILKGLIEGSTFYLRACLEALPSEIVIEKLHAAGGGSKSEAWLQVCADILGRQVVQPVINEAGALGAAILAGAGSGVFNSMREGVQAMVKQRRTFEPRPAVQRLYDDRFEKYQKLWPLLESYLRILINLAKAGFEAHVNRVHLPTFARLKSHRSGAQRWQGTSGRSSKPSLRASAQEARRSGQQDQFGERPRFRLTSMKALQVRVARPKPRKRSSVRMSISASPEPTKTAVHSLASSPLCNRQTPKRRLAGSTSGW